MTEELKSQLIYRLKIMFSDCPWPVDLDGQLYNLFTNLLNGTAQYNNPFQSVPENERRILLCGVILLFEQTQPLADVVITNFQDFLKEYPEFYGTAMSDRRELECLLHFRNYLAILKAMGINPNRRKVFLLKLLGRLDNSNDDYVIGGGQKLGTSKRLLIYYRESGLNIEKDAYVERYANLPSAPPATLFAAQAAMLPPRPSAQAVFSQQLPSFSSAPMRQGTSNHTGIAMAISMDTSNSSSVTTVPMDEENEMVEEVDKVEDRRAMFQKSKTKRVLDNLPLEEEQPTEMWLPQRFESDPITMTSEEFNILINQDLYTGSFTQTIRENNID